MRKIGRFTDDAARVSYLRSYDMMEALWPLPAEQVDVDTSYGPTHVRRSGTGHGIPLVLIHGLNGTGLSWHRAAAELARDREIIAVDTLGTAGRSVQTAAFEGEAGLGHWFGEVVSGLALDQVHLLGESHGAWHAALVALHTPARLAGLTLIEPNGFLTRPRLRALLTFVRLSARPTDAGWQKMSEWLTPGISLTAAEVDTARAGLKFRPGVGWARVLSDAELTRLPLPMLALFGAESVLSEPETSVRRLTALLPDAEAVIVPGGGHAVHAQFPELVRPRILDFLARHDTSEAPRG